MVGLDIEWIKVPGGDFLTGLSESQRAIMRENLRKAFDIDKLDSHSQKIVASVVEKGYRNVWEEGYSILEDTSSEEQRIIGGLDNPLLSYTVNLEELERAAPPEKRMHLDTFYMARFPITRAQADKFFESDQARQFKLGQQRYKQKDSS